MDDSYFSDMREEYARKRDLICSTLEDAGFDVVRPQGSYYVLANYSSLRQTHKGFEDDFAACKSLISICGIGTVPGRSFFADPNDGKDLLRFCYAKDWDVLSEACDRIRQAFA
jgi:aminotransferase